MSYYHNTITKVLKCNDKVADQVEELMREQSGGVLDHLDTRRFNKLARQQHQVLIKLSIMHPDQFSLT